jgi:hypothetical protein
MAVSAVSSTCPVATTFNNTNGETARFFLRNNPWKCNDNNAQQKIFRYCIICGEDRFSAEEWSSMARARLVIGQPLLTCTKFSCSGNVQSTEKFIHPNHLKIQTEIDEICTQIDPKEGFFETVADVTTVIILDKVYKSEAEMPPEYRELLKRLEGLPLSRRVAEIDTVYFSYLEENNITLGQRMGDESDPFLKMLADYRQKVYRLFQGINLLQLTQ